MVQKIRLNILLEDDILFYSNDNDIIRPLCVKLLPMIGYVKNFDNSKTMLLKVADN